MTTLEVVRGELVGDAGVTALVPAARIYAGKAKQSTAFPYIVITVVSDVPEHTLTGSIATTLRGARVQIDAYARDTATKSGYRLAGEISQAIEDAIGDIATPTLSVILENVRELYDDETESHRVSADYSVYRARA